MGHSNQCLSQTVYFNHRPFRYRPSKVMKNGVRDDMVVLVEASEVEGPLGTCAPNTVAPLELVMFKMEEIVLQKSIHKEDDSFVLIDVHKWVSKVAIV